MCGFTGFLKPDGFGADAKLVLEQMAATIEHRGPDDAGSWLDSEAGIGLAHRRLSIVDLSAAGHQPMISGSERYVLVFNGEIYNHVQIRHKAQKAGYQAWRGQSDTETLLAAIDLWGLASALEMIVGMFTLALWDRQTRKLSLARDRLGEKPLYYGWQKGALLFGSELKALVAYPGFERHLDMVSLRRYLSYGYIPSPQSIWSGIFKLSPGCLIEFSSATVGELPEPASYWSLPKVIACGFNSPFLGSDLDAIDALEALLTEAVAGQMVADVPLGAFLSGGIDSTTVVALMQAQSSRKVKTFTIGFDETAYNEAEHAKAVAAHLGTEHTELYISAADALAVIPKLPFMYDEPFGDPSAIPTNLVSKLARQHVTVSLSGDGGDELFGGYPHYVSSATVWNSTRRLPRVLRQVSGNFLTALPRLGSEHTRVGRGVQRMRSLGRQMTIDNLADFLDARRAIFRNPDVILRHPVAGHQKFSSRIPLPSNPLAAMMGYEAGQYLPDDILTKVDRASMAVSLESRAPLLDHRVVELSARLPMNMKIRGDTGKWILRELLYRHVPRALVDRKKAGFGVPIHDWLRGPLRDFGEELLSTEFMERQSLFNTKLLQQQWLLFQAGRLDYGSQFWVLLMFQSWWRENEIF